MNGKQDDYSTELLVAVLKAAAGLRDCVEKVKQSWNPGEGCPRNSPRLNDNWADARSGTWSTASWIYTLCECGEGHWPQLRDAIRWLILSCQNEDGSFPHFQEDRQRGGEQYVLPTAYFILALQECRKRLVYPFDGTEDEGSCKANEALMNAVKWLLGAARLENRGRTRTCSWGLKPAALSIEPTYTVSTALTIQALASVHSCSEFTNNLTQRQKQELSRSIKAGIRWIQQRKCMSRRMGGWSGSGGDTEPRDYPTALAIQGLQACGAPVSAAELRKAISFLKSQQRPDGGWASYLEIPCEVLCYSAPAVIYTIFAFDREGIHDESMANGFLWLISRAKDGLVQLEGNPRVTIWPTREWVLYVSKICVAIGSKSLGHIASTYATIKDRLEVSERSRESLRRRVALEVERRVDEERKSFRRWRRLSFIIGIWVVCLLVASLIMVSELQIQGHWVVVMYSVPTVIAGAAAGLLR